MRNIQKKLGAAIKAARKQMKLTQAELAERLGISERYLQSIENEEQIPSYSMLEHILDYLNIPIAEILEPDDDNMTSGKRKLFYLINNKCDESDIAVLLSTAEALVGKKSK